MKLYEIDETLEALVGIDNGRYVNTETGEIIDEEQLNALQMEKERIVEYLCLMVKNDKACENAITEEINRLEAKKKAYVNHPKGLKRLIFKTLHGEKFKTKLVNVYYQPGKPHVEFEEGYDYKTLPAEFQKVTVEPKKDMLLKALKCGEEFKGVRIGIGEISVVIR